MKNKPNLLVIVAQVDGVGLMLLTIGKTTTLPHVEVAALA
jgi:hypothetical protein